MSTWPLLGRLALVAAGVLIVAAIITVLSDRSSRPDTSSIASRPTPTTSTPTTSTPTTSTPITSTPPTSTPRSTALLPLTIAAASHFDSYDREAHFGAFRDVDGCRNTRAAVLIRTSSAPVTFTRASECTVKTGKWRDPWSGVTTTNARDFQIDHTVPLANAWRSGAWDWSPAQRIAYANDLDDADHLIPVVAAENQSKGDRGPDEWRPPRRDAWCRYARAWNRIKAKWQLSATRSEWDALVVMARTC